MYKAPRGTMDILPPETSSWQMVEKRIAKMMDLFGYEEIRTPIFELTELFQRGVGEQTDIVEKEMYTFEDRKGRSFTLRPEGTACVIRAYIQNKMAPRNDSSVKLYYSGPMFRYERPQKGRYRQFHQYGAELINNSSPFADAEIIELSYRILASLEIPDLKLEINSVGCSDCRDDYKAALVEHLKKHEAQLCPDCISRMERNPLRTLDCKIPSCQEVMASAPSILDYQCDACRTHFDAVQHALADINISFDINPKLVRGLDYYTRTTFEIKYAGLGAQDALLGGGRYDGLVEELGGKRTECIGFAGGYERLLLVLKALNKTVPQSKLNAFVCSMSSQTQLLAFQLMSELRGNGLMAEMNFQPASLKSLLKKAAQSGAQWSLILGEEELSHGHLIVRNLMNSSQKEIPLKQVVEFLKKG